MPCFSSVVAADRRRTCLPVPVPSVLHRWMAHRETAIRLQRAGRTTVRMSHRHRHWPKFRSTPSHQCWPHASPMQPFSACLPPIVPHSTTSHSLTMRRTSGKLDARGTPRRASRRMSRYAFGPWKSRPSGLGIYSITSRMGWWTKTSRCANGRKNSMLSSSNGRPVPWCRWTGKRTSVQRRGRRSATDYPFSSPNQEGITCRNDRF